MTTNNESNGKLFYTSKYDFTSKHDFTYPKNKWTMTIGNYSVYQTTEYCAWKAFWLRFMGWKVEKINDNTTS